MKKLNPVLLAIYTLIVFPSLAYSIWQFTRFSEMEKEITTVYKNQLKTVLFSLNSYGEDYLSQALSEMETVLLNSDSEAAAEKILSKRRFINAIVLAKNPDFSDCRLTGGTETAVPVIKRYAVNMKTAISRLPKYLEAGYSKKEAFTDSLISVIFFCYKDKNGIPVYSAISVILPVLYQTIYNPKLTSEEYREYLIQIKNSTTNLFRSSAKSPSGKIEVKKEAVLFPGIELSIQPLGITLEQIVKERTRYNIALLFALNIVVIFAVIIIYKTTQKQTELARQKSEFVANVSHELRTPLSLIRMFAETLSSNRLTDETKKQNYYKMIVAETERLTALINTVLTFSKMESGKRQFNKTVFHFDELLNEIIASRDSSLREKGFSFRFTLAESNYRINGDKDALSEVIINLLDNAEKYSLTHKEIIVSLNCNASHLLVQIEDKGIGIPEKYLPKIFEKFYRVPTGDIHNVKGTGLGLSIVKQIIEAHGGNIKVFSREGAGSRFEISLPIYIETAIQ